MDESKRDPVSASQTLVLLPNHRACRLLKDLLQQLAVEQTLILPRIHAIGNAENDLALQIQCQNTNASGVDKRPKVISKLKRRFELAKLCMAIDMNQGQPSITLTQALELAQALATLMDELQREKIDLGKIEDLAPEEYSEHWQSILKFLHIITVYWPRILQENNEQDPVTFRNEMLGALGKFWKAHPPTYKIIIAGSTASNVATAELMAIVAALPNAQVILPAFHLMPKKQAYWEHIQESHPHYFLKQFIEMIDLDADKVVVLDNPEVPATCAPERLELVEQMMFPAQNIHEWVHIKASKEALAGLQCLILESLENEAETIALICRQSLTKASTKLCIVCEDAELRTKIRYALNAYDVIADASEGMSLLDSAWSHFMQLLLTAAENKHDAVNLLALLKHPYTTIAKARQSILQAARYMELHVFRSSAQTHRLSLVKVKLKKLAEPEALLALEVLEQYEHLLAPLEKLIHAKKCSFSELWNSHLKIAEQFLINDAAIMPFKQKPSYQDIQQFVDSLTEHADHLGEVDPNDYAATLNQLMSFETYREFLDVAHNVRILPSAEARLETADVMIISGLNEGSWPKQLAANPWMSRTMQSALGLNMPEVNSSRMAHDWVMLMHAPKIFLTRARKAAGAETLESRWLQRLRACCHAAPSDVADTMFSNAPYIDWLHQLHEAEHIEAMTQPAPKPPAANRPTSFSVTELELLQRDPYAIYAKRILGLKPLEPLGDASPQKLFGEIAHTMLEQWSQTSLADRTNILTEQESDALISGVLNSYAIEQTQRYLLKPRLQAILLWADEAFEARKADINRVEAEMKMQMNLMGQNATYTLSGRADRIEYYKNQNAVIIDYKTGGLPSQKDVKAHLACQLPVECLMLMANESYQPANINFEYWKLSSRKDKSIIRAADKKIVMDHFLTKTADHIKNLLDSYMNESKPYTAIPDSAIKPKYHSYAHLERYAEWV